MTPPLDARPILPSADEVDELDGRIDQVEAQLSRLRKKRADVVAGVAKIQRVKKGCRHHPQRHFKVSAHEWRCSECGRVGVWTKSWQWLGAHGCRKCSNEPAIEAVTCSDACRLKFDASSQQQSELTYDPLS